MRTLCPVREPLKGDAGTHCYLLSSRGEKSDRACPASEYKQSAQTEAHRPQWKKRYHLDVTAIMQKSELYKYNVVNNSIIFPFIHTDLFLQSHLLFSHLPVVTANSVLQGENVLHTFLHISKHFHSLPHLKREERFGLLKIYSGCLSWLTTYV